MKRSFNVLSVLILAAHTTALVSCGSEKTNPTVEVSALQAAEARLPKTIDLELADDLIEGLKSTQTKLNLSKEVYQQFVQILPAELGTLIGNLISSSGVTSLVVNQDGHALKFVLNGSQPSIDVGLSSPIKFAAEVSIDEIDSDSGDVDTVKISGLTIDDKAIEKLAIGEDHSLLIWTEGAQVPVVTRSLTPDAKMRAELGNLSSGALMHALFSLCHVIQSSPTEQRIHIMAKERDESGKAKLDAHGRSVPNTQSRLRTSLRKMFVEFGTPAEFLRLYDEATDIVIDNKGFQIWLRQPVQLNFSQGTLYLANFVQLQSSGSHMVIPVRGVSTAAHGADGATLQNLRVRKHGTAYYLDAQVYGYRDTLLGQFGKSEVVSFRM